jgi:hypothetical protein
MPVLWPHEHIITIKDKLNIKKFVMKNSNRSHLVILVVASLMLTALFSGCTGILKATFENDTLGALPDKSLPGNPTGDAISYATEIETQLEVVSTPSNATNKSLRYQSVPLSGSIGGHGSWLGFRGKSTNFAKPVTFIWTAQKIFNASGSDLNIDCSDGSGVVAARIKILKTGDVILVNDIASGTGANVGSIPNNEVHTFMVTVDLPNEVYNISVLKPSGNIVSNGNTLLTENISLFHNPANPSASFRYDVFSSSQQYIIDEVFINRRN